MEVLPQESKRHHTQGLPIYNRVYDLKPDLSITSSSLSSFWMATHLQAHQQWNTAGTKPILWHSAALSISTGKTPMESWCEYDKQAKKEKGYFQEAQTGEILKG